MTPFFKKCGLAGLLFALVYSFGCGGSAQHKDRRESRDPMIQRALNKEKGNDIEGAIEAYEKAIKKKPEMATPHLKLGLIYHEKLRDYVRAIYHYERYLEMRPDAEKKQNLEDLISFAKLDFAASLSDQPSGAVKQIAKLKREIAFLEARIAQLSGKKPPEPPARVSGGNNGDSKPVRVTPRPAPPKPPVKTYRVREGDTLTSIAKKMYGDSSKWEKIFNANRNQLRSPKSLNIGMTLVIPK